MRSDIAAPSGKVLPHDLDIEQSLIGSILLSPKTIECVAGIVSPDGFYDSTHAVIYQGAIALHQQMRQVDLNTVASCLNDQRQLTRIGGKAVLVKLQESAPYGLDAEQYAHIIQGYYVRRRLIEVSQEIAEAAYNTSEDLNSVIELSEQKFFAVTQQHVKGSGFRSAADLTDGFLAQVEERSQSGALPGLPTGLYDIDAATNGFKAGKAIYLIGRPGMGKSAIALQMAEYFATTVKCTVGYFSLEMPAEEQYGRMVSSESGIVSGALETGLIAPNEWERLGHAIAKLSQNTHLEFEDTPGLSIEEIASKCRSLQARKGDLGAVFIDHLHLLNYGKRTEVEALSHITKQIKNLARELKIPIFVLAQLNRGVEERADKRPLMSDIRGCGTAEQDADMIAGLYRDEYYNKNTVDRGIIEFIILKQRGGPTPTVKLLFEPQFTRFKNLAGGRNSEVHKPPTLPQPEYTYEPPAEQRDRELANAFTESDLYGDDF
ncbi:MAG TPA: replicative DNA helicase [Coleofasciculaceae cyanobacterium]